MKTPPVIPSDAWEHIRHTSSCILTSHEELWKNFLCWWQFILLLCEWLFVYYFLTAMSSNMMITCLIWLWFTFCFSSPMEFLIDLFCNTYSWGTMYFFRTNIFFYVSIYSWPLHVAMLYDHHCLVTLVIVNE